MLARFRRPAIILGIILTAYACLGFFLAPLIARSQILKSLDRALTTRATLDRVRINPFALSITLDRLRIPDAEGKPVVGFDQLYLRLDPMRSLFLGAPTLAKFRLVRPAATVEILPDRTINLLHLLRPQPATAADTTGEPPRFQVHQFQLMDGSLVVADRSRAPAFVRTLAPIHLDLRDFGTRRQSANAYSFEARTQAGETIAWSGRFTVKPFRSDGELIFGNVRAKTLADLAGDQMPFILSTGSFTFHSRYRIDAAKVPFDAHLLEIGIGGSDASILDRASGDEVLRAATLATKNGSFDLGHLLLDLGEVSAHQARVLTWMTPDGHINFERWAQAFPPDTVKPLTTRIPVGHVDGLQVEFQDRRVRPPAIFQTRGTVDFQHFDTARDSSFHLSAACSLGTSGMATASGMVKPSTPSADLQIVTEGIDLRLIQPYVSAFARLDIMHGAADAKGRLWFNTFGAKGPLMRYAGGVTVRDFRAVDRKVGMDFLRWKRLDLNHLEYDMLPGRLALHEIVATQPYIRAVVAADRTTNIQALAAPPDSVPPAFRPVPGQPDTIPARIDLVRVLDGSAFFADLSLTPNFATGIQALNGTIRELSSAEAAHAEVQLDGKVDAYAPVQITGTVNPLNGRGRTDLSVSFKNIELTTFSPYSGKFMGYRIEKGKLDLDLNYKIQDRTLDASNKIFMRQLTLGDKVPSAEATHLPVRFAIALLKDREGNINLNLPVKGNLDDPKFSVFPIIMKLLIGLVTKAVASPFALIGAVFGGNGEHGTPAVVFRFGSSELDTTATRVLDAVRKGLADKPGLKLEIEQPPKADGDSLALLARRYDETLRRAGPPGKNPPTPSQFEAALRLTPAGFTPEEWVPLLTRTYTTQFGKPPALEGPTRHPKKGEPADSATVAAEAKRLKLMDNRIRTKIAVDPTEVSGLSRDRASRVQGFLLADSTIAAERVFITIGKDVVGADSSGVMVGLKLTD